MLSFSTWRTRLASGQEAMSAADQPTAPERGTPSNHNRNRVVSSQNVARRVEHVVPVSSVGLAEKAGGIYSEALIPDERNFVSAPEYLNEDWPKNGYFLFPLSAQLDIPAKEMIYSLHRVKKRYRFKDSKQSEQTEATTDLDINREIQRRVIDRKIALRRTEDLQVKAFGATLNRSRHQAHQNMLMKSCQTVTVEVRPPRSQAAAEFLRCLNRRETNTKTVFELLTESQHKKHAEHKHRRRNTSVGITSNKTVVESGAPLVGISEQCSESDSDSEASADMYTEEAVVRRLSTMPVSSRASRGSILMLNRRRSEILVKAVSEERRVVGRVCTVVLVLYYMQLLRSKLRKLKAELAWGTIAGGTKAIILLQAKVRRFLAQKAYIKRQLAMNMILVFVRIGLFRIMVRKRRSATDMIVQFVRDHSKKRQLGKIVTFFLAKVRVCQKACRALLKCRRERVHSLQLYATSKLGLNFDKFVQLKMSMQTLFTEKLMQLVATRRREYWKRVDLAKLMLKRGEGVFHTVKVEDAKLFLSRKDVNGTCVGGGTTSGSKHWLPQVSGLGDGVSNLSWKLYTLPFLDDLLRKYHHFAVEAAKSLAEQAHLADSRNQRRQHHGLDSVQCAGRFRKGSAAVSSVNLSSLMNDGSEMPADLRKASVSYRPLLRPQQSGFRCPGKPLKDTHVSDGQAAALNMGPNQSCIDDIPFLNRPTRQDFAERTEGPKPVTTAPLEPQRPTSSRPRSTASYGVQHTRRVHINNYKGLPGDVPPPSLTRERPASAIAGSGRSLVPTAVWEAIKDVETFMGKEKMERQAFNQFVLNERFASKGKPKKIK
jgi:hypothetical protein